MNEDHIDLTTLTFGAYRRKSEEDKKRQILSLGDQERELKELQKHHGLKVAKWYEGESRSAHKRGRPIFGDMIQDIEDGVIDAIVVWQPNRLARNLSDGGTVITLMDEKKLKSIVTPSRAYFNTGSDKAWLGSQFVEAKKTSDEGGESVVRALHGKRLEGWLPGTAPLGYLNTRSAIRGSNTIIKDPERFDVLRKAWDLMLTGHYSVEEIRYKLNNEWGMRTRQWNERGGKPVSKSGLYKMFTDPFYMGVIPYQKGGKREGKNNPVVLMPGRHPRMVERDEYDKVQIILGREGKPRPNRNEYAYNGDVVCGECGGTVSATYKERILKSTGELKRYTLYYCTTARRHPELCSQSIYTRVATIEDEVELFLAKATITPELRDWALRILEEDGAEIERTNKTIAKTKDKLIEEAQSELDELLSLRLRRKIKDEEFDRLHTKLTNDIALLRVEKNEEMDTAENWLDLTAEAFEFATYAHKAFTSGDAKTKRAILAAVGLNRRLFDGTFSFEAVDWLIPIAERPNALGAIPKAFEPEPTRTSGTKSRFEEFRPVMRSRRDLNPQPLACTISAIFIAAWTISSP